MFGWLAGKRELKTSKRVTIIDLEGNSQECLVNIDNFNELPINFVCEYEVSGTWGSAKIPIVSTLTQYTGDAEEAAQLALKYGPKPVPRLKAVLTKCAEFINSTPDQSNGGLPRQVTYEQFEEAVRWFLSNDDEDEEYGDVMLNRLALSSKCPGSLKYHDSQDGGLIRHTAKMLELYMKCFGTQEWSFYQVHPLRCITGILFHDMGKIDQYAYDANSKSWSYADYAPYRGNHIGMAVERWARKGRKICEILGDKSMYWDVLHIIATHHGDPSNGFGSLWKPFGPDAETVHALDMMDSRQDETGV